MLATEKHNDLWSKKIQQQFDNKIKVIDKME